MFQREVKKNNKIQGEKSFLEDLELACSNVDSRLIEGYTLDAINKLPDQKKKTRFQRLERVFAYELYHQFRLLIEKNPSKYTDLMLNGEVHKKNIFGSENYDERKPLSRLCGRGVSYIPDIVLHQGFDNIETNQKIAVEIKIDNINPKEIWCDLMKLSYYKSKLKFDFGVFISYGVHFDILEEIIIDYFRDPSNSMKPLPAFTRIIIINIDASNHGAYNVKTLMELFTKK